MVRGHDVGRTFADDLAAFEQVEVVDHLQRRLDVLLDQQHRQAAIDQQADAGEQVGDQPGREARGRLVQHQHARAGEQGAPDREHLPFAAGECCALVRTALGEAREELENLGDGEEMPAGRVRGRPHQCQVLVDGQLRKDVLAFRHQRKAARHPLVRGEFLDAASFELDAAGDHGAATGPAGERIDQRGLAGAVGADEANHSPRGHADIDA
ncbi:hypothetical protein ACVWZ3_002819 [Bradyrhizobium sp. i1.3.6]